MPPAPYLNTSPVLGDRVCPHSSCQVIGDYVTVGHAVILHGCTIGNECLIGMGSIIMDDVVIPGRVMIGAGADG